MRGSAASPSLADIDGHGDLNAFARNSAGNTQFCLNAGSFAGAAVTSITANGRYTIG